VEVSRLVIMTHGLTMEHEWTPPSPLNPTEHWQSQWHTEETTRLLCTTGFAGATPPLEAPAGGEVVFKVSTRRDDPQALYKNYKIAILSAREQRTWP
jgi:hypothetical protein